MSPYSPISPKQGASLDLLPEHAPHRRWRGTPDERVPRPETTGAPVQGPAELHVVPEGSSWELELGGRSTVLARFERKADAVERAEEVLERTEGELLIHRSDGSIQDHRGAG